MHCLSVFAGVRAVIHTSPLCALQPKTVTTNWKLTDEGAKPPFLTVQRACCDSSRVSFSLACASLAFLLFHSCPAASCCSTAPELRDCIAQPLVPLVGQLLIQLHCHGGVCYSPLITKGDEDSLAHDCHHVA